MQRKFVRYSDDVEQIPADEAKTIEQLLESMRRLEGRDEEKYGKAVRVSHGKIHGAAVGELTVSGDLPDELRQGLFARAKTYPVIARLANVPGEIVTDAVNTQRGFSFKILGVDGEKLPGHAGESTQDFVFDTGDRFPMSNVEQFLSQHLMIEHAPQMPDAVKVAVSNVSRVTNDALHAVGLDSAKLDFFGSPKVHPLGEAYFSQAPVRYGDYVAKLALVPVAVAQTALAEEKVDDHDPNALRTATVGYLREHDAEFDLRVQLCTDLEKMPVEDANVEWSEDESPYRTVARLRLPRQDAYTPERAAYVDSLSFCVSHSLAAHRPLGSIMRGRLAAYPELSRIRRTANGDPLTEPASVDAVPA